MAKPITRSKACSRNSSKGFGRQGFSLVELLVAAAVGLVILSATLALTLSSKKIYDVDRARTAVNQNLRSALDLVGNDVRVAGERLSSKNNLPLAAVEVRGGNQLVLRRNLLNETLSLCEKKLNPNQDVIKVALDKKRGGVDPDDYKGCQTKDDTFDADDSLAAWQTYRTGHGGAVTAYIFTKGTGKSDFFVYDGDDASNFQIHKTGRLGSTYTVEEEPILMLVEERSYRLNGDVLEVVVNGDTQNAQKLVNKVSDFQVRAVRTNGALDTDYKGSGSDWSTLAGVEVSVTGQTTERGKTTTRTLTSRFFPRNVLSN